MEPPSPRYLMYARRSSDRDDMQLLSLEQQLTILRELAFTRNLDVVEVQSESVSAKESSRPGFLELVKKIETGKVDGILVWRLDRLARNAMDGGYLIHLLSTGKLKFIVTPEATYTGSGDAKFMLAMLFGAAAKYSDDLSTAVKRGEEAVLRKGKIPGPVPLGYMKTHEHETTPGAGTVIRDPERFELVKCVWKEVLGGNTNVREVWRQALSWGLSTRPKRATLSKPVSVAIIYALLRNPFYAGKVKWGERLFDGEHPPMVTWEEFERVQRMIRKHHRDAGTPIHHDFLFHGLVHCHCGRALVGERHAKHGHAWTYYKCSRKKPGTYRCPERPIPEPDLIEAVAKVLDQVVIDPTIQEWAFEAVAWWADGEPSPEKLVGRAKTQLAAAERELATVTDFAVGGHLTKAEYAVRRENLLAKIEHLREALAEPVARLEAWRALRDEKTRGGLELGREFREGDVLTKRRILAKVATDVVLRDHVPTISFKAPFQILGTSTAA